MAKEGHHENTQGREDLNMGNIAKYYVVFLVMISGLFSCENREAARSPAIDRAPIEDFKPIPQSPKKKMRRVVSRSANYC